MRVKVALLPTKSGTLSLPSIALVWERGGTGTGTSNAISNSNNNNSIRLFDMGRSEQHTQYIFIEPVEE